MRSMKSLNLGNFLTVSSLLLGGVGLIHSCGRNDSMVLTPNPTAPPATTGLIGVSSSFGDPPVVNQAQGVSLTLLWE